VRRLALAGIFAPLAACGGASEPTPTATVAFTIDAPFCGSRIPAVFSIDGVRVGADTFVVHLAGEHLTTRPFTTAPGRHTLGATAGYYTWPDTQVTLGPGQALTHTLSFYCS
jgi:hypothetical protein